MAELLVVEDDPTIGAVLRSSLTAHGHQVAWKTCGADALAIAASRNFDLIMLDLGLPDMDGVDLCRQLRTDQPAAVLVVLTARDEEIDIVLGLDAGADDYLTKPFRLAELVARVAAHLRRAEASTPDPADSRLRTVGALTVDAAARRVWVGAAEVTLRAKEFDLLDRLAVDAGTALSRTVLMADVWDPHWFGSTKTLDVHVSGLRGKLDSAAAAAGVSPPHIATVRAHGYRLDVPEGSPVTASG